uniref:Uncharacterized protein n=1 Tax=Arundo donax TaxID=35708 RepID=A0A0A8YP49_ARUDO
MIICRQVACSYFSNIILQKYAEGLPCTGVDPEGLPCVGADPEGLPGTGVGADPEGLPGPGVGADAEGLPGAGGTKPAN